MLARKLQRVFAAICTTFILVSGSASAQQYDRLVQIVIDDTGSLQDSMDRNKRTARETVLNYLRAVSDDYGRNDLVVVISQYSASNVWVGEPRDITRGRSNQGLQTFLTQKPSGCSDLPPVLRILSDNMEAYEYEELEIVFFSSLVHTGRPCDGVRLPSNLTLPENFLTDLDKFTSQHNTASYSFYWVFDEQDANIREALTDFRRKSSVDVTIKVEAETRSTRF